MLLFFCDFVCSASTVNDTHAAKNGKEKKRREIRRSFPNKNGKTALLRFPFSLFLYAPNCHCCSAEMIGKSIFCVLSLPTLSRLLLFLLKNSLISFSSSPFFLFRLFYSQWWKNLFFPFRSLRISGKFNIIKVESSARHLRAPTPLGQLFDSMLSSFSPPSSPSVLRPNEERFM